jgi:aryl-alcohol dehydrogenase-like predicted oxidoreductase
MDRRVALGGILAGMSALAATRTRGVLAVGSPDVEQEGMMYRTLGKTGERVSAIGIGGSHLSRGPSEDEAIRIVRTAVDRGITFLDNSWDYGKVESEKRMGKALRDGYRERVFLMTKFDGRTKKSAAKQLDESLKRLQTDHVDLWQFHENIRLEDPDRFFQDGGCVETVNDARKAGKIRFVGFTGHKDPWLHLRMLELASQRGFRFDTCQMPLNVMDARFSSFTTQVLPRLVEQEIGVLGMKPMGDGNVLKSGSVTAMECLHYALSLPASVIITGCDSLDRLDQALEAANASQMGEWQGCN